MKNLCFVKIVNHSRFMLKMSVNRKKKKFVDNKRALDKMKKNSSTVTPTLMPNVCSIQVITHSMQCADFGEALPNVDSKHIVPNVKIRATGANKLEDL